MTKCFTLDEIHRKLIDNMLRGDRQALAKLCTKLERNEGQLAAVMSAVQTHTGGAYYVGLTGPPGAGKSTLVNQLVQTFRQDGFKVGVVAVDPSSPIRGGSVLGDRIRMGRHFLDEDVFIRSLATRGAHGGLSSITGAVVRLLDAFGMDIILLESVGVGQTELDTMNMVDTVVVTLVPGTGDYVQVIKAGLMEIADIFVVNKADIRGADRLAATIRAEHFSSRLEGWWDVPVLLTQAHRGVGVNELYQAILDHRCTSAETEHFQPRRAERWRHEFTRAFKDSIEAKIIERKGQIKLLDDILGKVEIGDVDPYSAAAEMLNSVEMGGFAEDKME